MILFLLAKFNITFQHNKIMDKCFFFFPNKLPQRACNYQPSRWWRLLMIADVTLI